VQTRSDTASIQEKEEVLESSYSFWLFNAAQMWASALSSSCWEKCSQQERKAGGYSV